MGLEGASPALRGWQGARYSRLARIWGCQAPGEPTTAGSCAQTPQGPSPSSRVTPGCLMRPCRLPPFQSHRSLGGPHGSNYRQESGEVGTGRGQQRPARGWGWGTLLCPAERAGLRGWAGQGVGFRAAHEGPGWQLRGFVVPFVTKTLWP